MARDVIGRNDDRLASQDQKMPDSFGALRDEPPREPAHQQTQLSSLRAAQIFWDAAGLALKGFQTVALMSYQNLRAWQDSWFVFVRSNR
jgi:hypothetical protein